MGGNLTVLLVLTCHVILSKERSYIRVLPGTYAYSSQVKSFFVYVLTVITYHTLIVNY